MASLCSGFLLEETGEKEVKETRRHGEKLCLWFIFFDTISTLLCYVDHGKKAILEQKKSAMKVTPPNRKLS